MGTYEFELKQMGKNIGKAFAIAGLVGLVLSICMGFFAESFGTGVECTIAFCIGLGSIFMLFTTAKAGTMPTLANVGIGFIRHLFLTCLSTMGSMSIVGLVIGMLGLIVTAGIGLVMVLFLTISFPLNLVFLIVMTVLERTQRLPSEEITAVLNKAVPVICGVASVVITWTMFSGM